MGLKEKYFIKIPNKKNFRQTATFQPYIATNLALASVNYKFESRFGTEDPVTGDLSQGYLDTFGVKNRFIKNNHLSEHFPSKL